MKILYAIQGTGNGHLARADDVVPVLREYGDLDLFVSGAQVDISISHPIKYKSKGLSFYFGKQGGVNFGKTIGRNNLFRVIREINEFPVQDYDLVINDFEPISAWAARKKKVPCIALSHQSAVLSPNVPRPSHFDPVGAIILKRYAPVDAHVGFHFKRYDKYIYTPVIRGDVQKAVPEDKGHITVYLPAYDDKKLVPLFAEIPGVRWHVFSKHTKSRYQVEGISVFPVNKEEFGQSMLTAHGVFCGAGFETPAEALFLRKRLLAIPMKSQYEQHFNAAALRDLGVPVLKRLNHSSLDTIREWIETDRVVDVSYPDIRREAIEHALRLKDEVKNAH